jgi:phosphoglycerate dehydrogenase-like enzyme
MRTRVLITDNNLGDSALEREQLERELDAVVFVRQCETEDDVIAAVHDTQPDALIVQWASITSAVMDAMPQCRFISRLGIGIEMIDLRAAETRGITVQNVPAYCIEEVATHAFASALTLWRAIPALDAQVRAGHWSAIDFAPAIQRLSAATVGIIGLGRIGRAVARGFQAWDARIVVYDPVADVSGFSQVDLADLFKESDIISMHAPLTDSTRHMINSDAIQLMERRPIIVNSSRGPLIDETALVDGLRSNKIRGAALDVFATEPLPLESPLRLLPNVLLTPHAAWASAPALPNLRTLAAQNVIDFFTLASA